MALKVAPPLALLFLSDTSVHSIVPLAAIKFHADVPVIVIRLTSEPLAIKSVTVCVVPLF